MRPKDLHAPAALGAASAARGPAAEAPDLVLANLEWVRALSRRLVQDAATADDLVQKAWLVARGKEADGGSPPRVRAWLSGVLRNLARDQGRQEARRRRREVESVAGSALGGDAAAGHEEAPEELISRSEQMTEVARLVLELDEPFRRAMLLRWFDGLTPAQVAEREGVPAGTVRSRLHRGLGELRARLDARHQGDTRSWALALIPAADLAPSGQGAAGAGSLKVAGWAATFLAVAGAIGWGVWARARADGESGREVELEAVAAARPLKLGSSGGSAVGAARPRGDEGPEVQLAPVPAVKPREARSQVRSPVAGPDGALEASRSAAVEDVEGHVLKGQVVLPDGTPVPEVYVNVRPEDDGTEEARGATSSDQVDGMGFFTIEGLEPGVYRASVGFSDTFAILGSPLFMAGTDTPHRIEVAARIVELYAQDEVGERVVLDWVRRADAVEDRDVLSEDGPGATTVKAAQGATEHSITVPVGVPYLITAGGVDGVEYTGLLAEGMAPGRYRVRLERRPAGFGSVTLVVESNQALPSEALLVQRSAEHSRISVHLEGQGVRTSPRRLELRYPALLPGAYTFRVGLSEAGPVGLRKGSFSVEVDAGVEQVIPVPAFVGGLVEVKVTAAVPLGERTLARLDVRRAGDVEWQERSFRTDERGRNGGGVFVNGSALVDGPAACSFPWEPGEYEVRARLAGHRPVSVSFRLLEGQTERVELELLREGG